MSIDESIYKQIKCSVSTDLSHYVDDAVLLPCSGNACKKCIEKLSDLKIKCSYCCQEHEKNEILKGASNQPNIKIVIKMCLNDLNKNLQEEFRQTIELFKENNINHEITKIIEIIENQIDIRTESIIIELNKHREELLNKLKCAKEAFKCSIFNNPSIKDQTDKINLHEKLACDLNYDNFMKTQEIIKESQDLLKNCLNKMNEIKFISNDESIEKSVIGELKIPLCCETPKESGRSSTSSLTFSKADSNNDLAFKFGATATFGDSSTTTTTSPSILERTTTNSTFDDTAKPSRFSFGVSSTTTTTSPSILERTTTNSTFDDTAKPSRFALGDSSTTTTTASTITPTFGLF